MQMGDAVGDSSCGCFAGRNLGLLFIPRQEAAAAASAAATKEEKKSRAHFFVLKLKRGP